MLAIQEKYIIYSIKIVSRVRKGEWKIIIKIPIKRKCCTKNIGELTVKYLVSIVKYLASRWLKGECGETAYTWIECSI